MTLDLEVQVLWGVDRSDPSQPQGEKRERLAESSGARDLRGDEQKSDMRRTGLRVSGPETATPSRSRRPDVDPALVQGQPRRLTWGDLGPSHRAEKSAAAIVAAGFGDGGPPRGEGPNGEESETTMRHGTARHQMSIDQMELPLETRGEAPTGERRGEARPTAREHGRSGADDQMDRVVERDNLSAALRRVRQKRGSAGIDGMTVDELRPYLRDHWPGIREALLAGTYQPSAVRQHPIPKAGGGVRTLGIPTVVDRFIQQAVLQVLQPQFDPTFSEASFGFRPGRSAHDAVRRAQQYVQAGRRWVVDIDLEQFFDRVNHDILMGMLHHRLADRRVLALIRRYLEAGMMVNGVVRERADGTPQGGPLSPLLANVLLDAVDQELERRGHCFVRYADDCNVYVRSRR